jgi:hypothetical protein
MTSTHWWQPGNPDKSLPGVLFEDEEHGWLLEIDGTFNEFDISALSAGGGPVQVPMDLPDSLPVVLGITSQGEMVSLVDCLVLGGSIPFAGTRGSMKIWPKTLAYGVHFWSADDFRLTSLSVRYSHLDTWVATTGFEVEFSPNVYPVQVRYTKPEPIEALLSEDLKISLDFSVAGPPFRPGTSLQITQQSWLTVTSTHGLPFDDLLKHVTGLKI